MQAANLQKKLRIQDSEWAVIRNKLDEDHIADGAREELKTVWLDYIRCDNSTVEATSTTPGEPKGSTSMADLGDNDGVDFCDD